MISKQRSSSLENCSVAFVKESTTYCPTPPYDPSERFPEWADHRLSTSDNPAYRGVRSLFIALGLDRDRSGTCEWNPLGDLIRPGDSVILKPNFVSHFNLGEAQGQTDTDSLVTHGSVIRVVLDYVGKALNGKGHVTLFDCPVQSADWDELLRITGLPQTAEHFRSRFPGVHLAIKDRRMAVALVKRVGGKRVITSRVERTVKPEDYVEVDLKQDSLLLPQMGPGVDFGVTEYPRHRMRCTHTKETNKYMFPTEVLRADVVINLPKLKTHCKGGITCALKNLVGINGHKDYLPHFRFGAPKHGGDEYPDGNWYWHFYWWLKHLAWERDRGNVKFFLNSLAYAMRPTFPYLVGVPHFANALGGGSWCGNDTLWRMVLDINRAFFFWDEARRAIVPGSGNRRYLAIVDGIVGGEAEGPLSPTPKEAGFLLAGSNPVAIDVVAATLMGFDFRKIPQLANAFATTNCRLPLVTFDPSVIRVVQESQASMSVEELANSSLCAASFRRADSASRCTAETNRQSPPDG